MRGAVMTLMLGGMLAGGPVAPVGEGVPDFFADRSTLQFILSTDLTVLLADRALNSPERPATLGYRDANGAPVWLPLKIKTRGKFRLVESVCDFPPIRLDFPAKQLTGTVFAGQNKLKLVTHCRTADPAYEQYVIQEYLSYRVYELLTPRSFRTRLAKVTYGDASVTHDPITGYAFVIEDEREMAGRTGAEIVELDGFHALLADEFEMGVHDVFQFMIGNTDWSTILSQNVKFLQDPAGNVTVVPFDFDWSGVVAAPYATPAPDIPITNVRERFYMGVCRWNDHLTAVFEHFVQLKGAIYDLYRNEEALTPEHRERTLRYYDEFYAIITDKTLAQNQIRDACRL